MTSAERQYHGSRLNKLGVKAGMRVLVVDITDPTFADEIAQAGTESAVCDENLVDLVFVGVHNVSDLKRIARYKTRLALDGALWLVRPKGPQTTVPESAAMTAGLEAGLVDVKVVSFSDSHSALKYVYRLRDR